MRFKSVFNMHDLFFRSAACTPRVNVAQCGANADSILSQLNEIADSCPDVVVMPEMCITAYTCGDLFHNETLLAGASDALRKLVENCPDSLPLVFVGMPVRTDGALFNCAVAFTRNRILGVVPKTYLPTYNEFYERRWFAPASALRSTEVEILPGCTVPMGTDLLFETSGAKVGAEICEDLWVSVPPSCALTASGADVIVNLSASDDITGKYDYLLSLVKQQSARCICGYVYASSGFGESSTDLVFQGKNIICENGHIEQCSERYSISPKIAMADIDIAALRRDRMHLTTYTDCACNNRMNCRIIKCPAAPAPTDGSLLRYVDPMPFVPSDSARMEERCKEILNIQTLGLARRLEATKSRSLVVGISGGLDSTLALLVAVKAFDCLGLDRKGIRGITMPGFGTTARTYNNALALMEELHITTMEIPIGPAVIQHFKDINHDSSVHDVTYENSQARERTQILMDVANQCGGMVLGTGDLSELALGWATYNGDHMSMYGVNAGVPKTLVRHLVQYFADSMPAGRGRDALIDIIGTPISPELIPADEHGNITQKTEDLVGPYELHDFFLYNTLRHGFTPRRIYRLAVKAFDGRFDDDTIKKWIKVFFRRFFTQQFKRSCLPDGPKVGSVTLSPRGDWRMPSDASAELWLNECENL